MKLIKLPNGDWLNASTIKSIKPFKFEIGMTGVNHPSRVVICFENDQYSSINCDSDAHAEKTADEIAALVNNTSPTSELRPTEKWS